MDGVHDMGGMHGFGEVPYERDEPAFHADWERRVWGLMFATTPPPGTTLDGIRHSLERIPPDLYLSYAYYEKWLHYVTTAQLAGGHVTPEEVGMGHAAPSSTQRDDAAGPETVNPYAVSDVRRDVDATPRFRVGDEVVTHNVHPAGHTRLPRYARSKRGTIALHHGAHVLPDANAHGLGETPTHLYTVRFRGAELWGEDAGPNDTMHLDVWECHLDPA